MEIDLETAKVDLDTLPPRLDIAMARPEPERTGPQQAPGWQRPAPKREAVPPPREQMSRDRAPEPRRSSWPVERRGLVEVAASSFGRRPARAGRVEVKGEPPRTRARREYSLVGDAAPDARPDPEECRKGPKRLPPARGKRPLSRFAGGGDDAPSFYLSLSDLMSLLLVFFVLIFSLSGMERISAGEGPGGAKALALAAAAAGPKAEKPKAQKPAPEVAALLPGMIERTPVTLPRPGYTVRTAAKAAPEPEAAGRLLAMVTASRPMPVAALPQVDRPMESRVRRAVSGGDSGVEINRRGDKLVILLPEAITFDQGRAHLKPAMLSVLAKLAGVLSGYPDAKVLVSGHTCDVPIKNDQFASNWELSAARAAVVARALMDKGVKAGRVTIQGRADREPRAPNDSPAHRALNRRVEIELRTGSGRALSS